ncbi:MAG: zf-HC2 domain-containing protein [Candidatus Sumerlaeia bacterium]
MALKDTVLGSIDWLRVRLGLMPRCSWVQDRFGEYHTFELEPSEMRAVERHLDVCPGCAREWRKTERILSQLEAASPIADQLEEFSSEEFMAGAMARVDQYEFERISQPRERWALLQGIKNLFVFPNRLPRLTATLLLLVSISAFAYFTPELVRLVSGSDDRLESVATQKSNQNSPSPLVIGSSSTGSLGRFADQYSTANLPDTFKIPQQLNTLDLSPQLEQMTAEAQVEMLLPHTEAEWEAWARKEYPHIMWVYDVLSKSEYGINWDGKPAYIPEWAKHIWTDEVTMPTGWRALVFFSGEILSFDYPRSIDEPTVHSTLISMKLAAIIAGYDLNVNVNGYLQPNLEYRDIVDDTPLNGRVFFVPHGNMNNIVSMQKPDIRHNEYFISEYANNMVNAKSLFTRNMIYIATVAHCIPNEEWKQMEKETLNIICASNISTQILCSPADKNEISIRSSILFSKYSRNRDLFIYK